MAVFRIFYLRLLPRHIYTLDSHTRLRYIIQIHNVIQIIIWVLTQITLLKPSGQRSFHRHATMAMLTNAIRAQARALSLSSRTRLSSVALTGSHSSPSICPQLWCSRLLSTSQPQLNYGGVGTQNFRRPPEPSTTLWIGNVPFSADETDLREVFAPLAKIEDIRVGTSSHSEFPFQPPPVHTNLIRLQLLKEWSQMGGPVGSLISSSHLLQMPRKSLSTTHKTQLRSKEGILIWIMRQLGQKFLGSRTINSISMSLVARRTIWGMRSRTTSVILSASTWVSICLGFF